MAKSVFTRAAPQGNERDEFHFDSDARRSVCMMFGYHPPSFSLEKDDPKSDHQKDIFTVRAAKGEGEEVRVIGTLLVRTKQEMRRLQDLTE